VIEAHLAPAEGGEARREIVAGVGAAAEGAPRGNRAHDCGRAADGGPSDRRPVGVRRHCRRSAPRGRLRRAPPRQAAGARPRRGAGVQRRLLRRARPARAALDQDLRLTGAEVQATPAATAASGTCSTAGLIADGRTWMSGSRWQGRDVLRISVSNWATDAEDVAVAVQAVSDEPGGHCSGALVVAEAGGRVTGQTRYRCRDVLSRRPSARRRFSPRPVESRVTCGWTAGCN